MTELLHDPRMEKFMISVAAGKKFSGQDFILFVKTCKDTLARRIC